MSAVLAALFTDHATAEAVRTRLVTDGFPTDRVELTSRQEPGQAGTLPGENLAEQLDNYFCRVLDREEHRRYLADNVRDGKATIVVHPRGDIETDRAREILQRSQPLEILDKDLEDQAMEQAASPDEKPVVQKVLEGDKRN